MKKIHKQRLLKIAEHLESKNLAHKYFDFDVYNNDNSEEQNLDINCGTHGCAIGELPAVFPNIFKHVRNEIPARVDLELSGETKRRKDIEKFLGLNIDEYEMLFIPNRSSLIENFNNHYNSELIVLTSSATPEEVALNIYTFIVAKDDY